jgi:ribosome-binding factor A
MAGPDRNRAARVAEAIKIELADLVSREIKDPRVRAGLVTVSHVEVNRDLTVAEVGVSILSGQPDPVMKGLQAAAGFLRGPLARRLRLRVAPELRFHHDRSQEMATRLRDIVREDDSRRVIEEPEASPHAEPESSPHEEPESSPHAEASPHPEPAEDRRESDGD